jgi:hypothetical protein
VEFRPQTAADLDVLVRLARRGDKPRFFGRAGKEGTARPRNWETSLRFMESRALLRRPRVTSLRGHGCSVAHHMGHGHVRTGRVCAAPLRVIDASNEASGRPCELITQRLSNSSGGSPA